MSTEQYVLFSENLETGPIDLFHAKGTVLGTNASLTFRNNTLTTTHIEADTVTTRSDLKFKENIKNLSGSLEKLLKIQSKCYNYINDENKQKHNGYIAQEIKEICPEVVKVDERTGALLVNYIEIIPIITDAIKEIYEIIQKME